MSFNFMAAVIMGFPGGTSCLRNLPANTEDIRDMGFIPGYGRFPEGWAWQSTPIFLPGESHGQKNLVGDS